MVAAVVDPGGMRPWTAIFRKYVGKSDSYGKPVRNGIIQIQGSGMGNDVADVDVADITISVLGRPKVLIALGNSPLAFWVQPGLRAKRRRSLQKN